MGRGYAVGERRDWGKGTVRGGGGGGEKEGKDEVKDYEPETAHAHS